MPIEQLLLYLPGDQVRRFKKVPSRQRSAFVRQLLGQALGDPLYQAALAVEQDARLADEMSEWETAAICDGIPASSARKRRR